MYKEIRPSISCNRFIDSFWTFDKNEVCQTVKVLPDTCTDLIFDLKHNKRFISGIMGNFQLRELMPESDLLGIRFKAEQFGSLSKIPLWETKDLRPELSLVFTQYEQHMLSQLSGLESTTDKVNFLENFIVIASKKNQEKQDKLIVATAEKIRSLDGNVTVGDLAKSSTISLRQLERRFKNYIGLSLKEFSCIVRFEKASKTIKNLSGKSLLGIAFDTGFFDHSHMNYEFKRISGENPSFFR